MNEDEAADQWMAREFARFAEVNLLEKHHQIAGSLAVLSSDARCKLAPENFVKLMTGKTEL